VLLQATGTGILHWFGFEERFGRRSRVQNMMLVSLRRWVEGLSGPSFTAKEIRVTCAMFLCIVPIALAFVVFVRGIAPAAGFRGLGGDFPQFFMSGWLLNHYPPSWLYDLHLQERLLLEVRPVEQGLTLPYLYPPFLAILFRPLAFLPYAWAYAAWSAISLGLYVAGLLVMLREFGPTSRRDKETMFLLALAFEPFLVETIAGGQVSSLAFLCVALAIRSEHRARPLSCGAFLSLCLYKPTLLVLFLPMLVFSRRWRILAGFGAGVAVLLAVTALTMGPSVLADYVRTITHFGGLYFGSNAVLRGWKYVDLRGFMSLLTGEYSMGLLALGVAACWILPVLIRTWWTRGGLDARYPSRTWALTIVWTLLLNAYVPFYDCILVVLVFILMAHALSGPSQMRHQPALQWLALLAFVTALFSQAIASASGLQIFTLVLIMVAVYVRDVVAADATPCANNV